MTGFEEKRNTPRANVKLNIRMAQENVDAFGEYYALNISAGGIYIETKYPLALGTKLKLLCGSHVVYQIPTLQHPQPQLESISL